MTCRFPVNPECYPKVIAIAVIGFLMLMLPRQLQAQNSLPIQWSSVFMPIGQLSCTAYSPDGALMAIGGIGGVQIYSVPSYTLIGCPSTAAYRTTSITFSPDSKTLAVGGSNLLETVAVQEVWSVPSLKLLNSYKVQPGVVTSVAFSPNGKSLSNSVSTWNGDQNGTALNVWNLATGSQVVSLFIQAEFLYSIAYSPNGAMIADGGFGDSGLVELRSPLTGNVIRTFKTSTYIVNSVAFSPDGTTVAIGASQSGLGALELGNVATGEISNLPTMNIPNTVQYSPDGKTLAVGTVSNTGQSAGDIELWNVSTAQQITVLASATNDEVLAISFSPDGKSLSACGTGYNSTTYDSYSEEDIWDLAAASPITSIYPYIYGYSNTVTFSPNGEEVALSGSSLNANTNVSSSSISLWDASSGNLDKSLVTTVYAYSVQFSPDGSTLADAGQIGSKGALDLWDVATGALIHSLDTAANNVLDTVAFSPTGQTIADGGSSYNTLTSVYTGVLELWNMSTGTLNFSLKTSANRGVTSVTFSPDGTTLAVCGSGGDSVEEAFGVLELWNVSTGSLIASLDTGEYAPQSVMFSPDGRTLVNGGRDFIPSTNTLAGAIELWDVSSDSFLSTLSLTANTQTVNSVAYSPDGSELFASTDLGLQAFNATNGKYLNDFNAGSIQALAISSTGNQLAFTTLSNSVAVVQNPYLNDARVSSVTLAPGAVLGGSPTIGTVTLSSAAPVGGIAIALSSSSVSATVPQTVLVAAGATKATFTVLTYGVNAQTVVTITATGTISAKEAVLTINAARLTSISLSPATVGGGNTSVGTVTLSGPAGLGGTTISLSSNSSSATVPVAFEILSGQTSGTFTVNTVAVGSLSQAAINASLNGQTQTTLLTISPPQLVQVAVNPTQVTGGGVSTGTISLTGPTGPGGLLVMLSSNSADASVPKSIAVAAGMEAATFAINTVGVSTSKTVTITAKNGSVSKTASLTITPPTLLSVTLDPDAVSGGTSTTGTVTLSGIAGSGGVVVKLKSNSSSVSLGASVKVPAGKASATFVAKTIAVNSPTSAAVTASLGTVSQTTTLTINPPYLVSLALNPGTVTGGKSSVGTVTISSAAPDGGLEISLSSSDSTAIVPAIVKVPSGHETITFTIRTVATKSTTTSTISAAKGGSSLTDVLTIL